MLCPRRGSTESPPCPTYYLEAHNSVEKSKILVRKPRANTIDEYCTVCTLSHNEPRICLQRQDTAKILVRLNHFSASVHFISTESREYIVKWAYLTLTNAVIWRGVSYAHGTAMTAMARCVPCACDTSRQTTEFLNVIYIVIHDIFGWFLGDKVQESWEVFGTYSDSGSILQVRMWPAIS